LRFFAAKPELSDGKAGYFTNVDGINRFALVAVDPERPEEIIAVVSFAAPATTWMAACPVALREHHPPSQGQQLSCPGGFISGRQDL